MTPAEVRALQEGDLLDFERPGGLHSRGRVAMALDRFVRVDWLTAPRNYDVFDKQSAIWAWMTKL